MLFSLILARPRSKSSNHQVQDKVYMCHLHYGSSIFKDKGKLISLSFDLRHPRRLRTRPSLAYSSVSGRWEGMEQN